MTATAARLPTMMPVEKPAPFAPARRHPRAPVKLELQAQFDVLAEAFARTFELLAAQHDRIVALEAKIALPKPLAAVEPFAFVLPATKNAPARRCFDAAGFLGAIAERHRT